MMIIAFVLLTVTASASPFAYIPNDYSCSVSVVDTTNDTLNANIHVGTSPFGVACMPDGSKVYVTNLDSNNISVIDTATNKVLTSINVGSQPKGIIVSSDGSRVYVANSGGKSVSVINATVNQVISTITVGASPFGIAISSDGSRVYVANYGEASVSVINTATNRVISTISTLGFKPTRIACNPNGNAVYVTTSARIMVINPATNKIVKNIGTGGTPIGVAVNLDGSRVYVTNSISKGGNVAVIDSATNAIITKITVDKIPWGVSVTSDGSKVYVTSINTNRATVIDTFTNTVIRHIQTGNYPASLGQFIVDIPVVPPVTPIADFSTNSSSGEAPLIVQFTDKSQNVDSVSWDFNNDGITDSTEQNPVYVYTEPGSYTVNMNAINENGTDYKLINVYVF